MTPEQINIAIAEICGWTAPIGWDGHWPHRMHYSVPGSKPVTHGVPPGKKQERYTCDGMVLDNLEPIPNYSGSLDAMHEAEEWLKASSLDLWMLYWEGLVEIVLPSKEYWRAKAIQRATVFAKVCSKLKGGPQ